MAYRRNKKHSSWDLIPPIVKITKKGDKINYSFAKKKDGKLIWIGSQ